MQSRPGGLGSIGERRAIVSHRISIAPRSYANAILRGGLGGGAAKTAPGGLSVRLFTTAARSFRRVYHRFLVKFAPRAGARGAELSSRSFYTTPEFFQRMESDIYERR